MHLGRTDEALRHLTRSAEADLRRGSRIDAFCTCSNAAQLSLDLGRVEDCIALLDSLLAGTGRRSRRVGRPPRREPRLTRARALRAEEDLEAATAEFAALAAESAGWDDDPGSHAMIAAETAVLLGGSGEFGPAREAADQAIAAHARDPRYELLSNSPARTRPPPGPAARAPRVWPTPSPSSPTPTGSPTRPALVRAGVGVDALCS